MGDILDNLAFRPGDKVKLTDWHEFSWYWDGTDMDEHHTVTLAPETILEIYSSGQSGHTPPYYTFEMSHPQHGDICIDFDTTEALGIFKLHERFED
ncbi:hypothetical protein [Paenibacillus terrae]|uniref:Uncharacterized protein n=1 Tax=Paenibacillus terrae TaxID=159743 RepID=A0A0D7WZP6_9BACL|nr:hypothetical protein [Paenibacillus terrae]KJD44193.1 hypothetical protein QD47_18510 [Paenibacillus terrae]